MEYTRSQSGLILATESMDAAALEPLLRKLDPDLSLQAWPSRDGPPTWKVVRHFSRDHPPETICSWVDDSGRPLPLGEGLLDLVRRLDRNQRATYVDPDVRNRQLKEALDKNWDDETEALTDDWRFKHGRPVLPRSQSLRMSRDKQRAKGKKV